MRKAARVIVVKDGNLLVMHRNKFGQEYDTLPGGAVEMNESPEQAAQRELVEETGIIVSNLRLIFVEHAGNMYGDQYVYLADYVSGEPVLSEETAEFAINAMGKNLYQPMWLSLEDLANKPFVTEELKKKILQCIETSWPESVEEFSSQRVI